MIGQTLQNRYRLDALIGQGGMGAVYRAHDLLLDRDVAVKVLSASKLGSQGRERLLREARAAARLNHRNIVSVYDAGKTKDGSFIVMELVEGQPLSAVYLEEIPEILEVTRQVLAALGHAHSHGVVHRDLKPENVLILADGSAKLMDFGLARSAVATRITREEGIVGTVFYLAPEQALGREVDGRADLYSLGVMLYELITGRLPFDAQDVLAVVSQHIHGTVPPLRTHRPDLPVELEGAILKLLSKDPADRFDSAQAAWEAFSAFAKTKGQDDARLPPNNLPVQLNRFIGRVEEIEEVRNLLRTSRLVTLTGAGGSGKTRLALEVVGGLLRDYLNGVWLVELAALSDSALVPQALASVLDVREQAGRTLIDSLADYLHDRQVLLLLDNCEHLIDACAQIVERLLRGSTALRFLATSREALGIAGEVAWAVPTLSAPDPAQCRILAADLAIGAERLPEKLMEYESIRLFADRAVAVQPAFQLTWENAQAVAQICYRLDGIPLAIELAAARMRALSIDQILARLDDRFSLLTLGSRTALPRHQTLRATIDWSYELLPEEERRLFSRLSVFVDGWTLEAAEAVCASGEGDESSGLRSSAVIDLLSRLVGKSLVQMQTRGGTVRYRMLETIRQYARAKAMETEQLDVLQNAHMAFYLKLAEEAEIHLRTGNQLAWLERLETEHDNFRAALDWALASGNVEAALCLAGNLAWFWYFRGYWSEGRDWLERALVEEEKSRQETGKDFKAARIKALYGAGWLSDESGREEGYYQECLALSRAAGDDWGAGISLRGLGILAFNRDEEDPANELLNESIALFRAIGDDWGIAAGLMNLGWWLVVQGDQQAAESRWNEALDLFNQVGDRWGQAVVLDALSYLARLQNDYKLAVKHSKKSLSLFKELGDKAGIASSLSRLGGNAYRREEYAQAVALFEESLAIQREQGSTWDIAEILRVLALIAAIQGDFGRAHALLEESLARFRDLDSQNGVAFALVTLGFLEYCQGHIERAVNALEERWETLEKNSDRGALAFAALTLGQANIRRNELDRASELLHRSLEVYRELGEKFNIASALNGLGRLAHARDDLEQAGDLYRESLSIRKELGLKRGMAESLEDLGRLAVNQGQMDQALRFFAAAGALRSASGAPLLPVDRPNYEHSMAAAQVAMGEAAFEVAWAEAQQMGWERIVECALEALE